MSDHVGDCEAPCSITCPAGMNIPQMNRLIASGKFEEALNAVKEEIALPYVLGYICPAPCEKACRRKQVDESVSICILKRFTAQHNHVPEPISQHPSSGKVAIIGAGPAGLAGAYYLQKMGYACVVFDKNENAGGNLRYAIPDKDLPKHSLDAEVEIIRQLGAEFRYNSMISADNFETEVRQKFDAVIVATGDIAISNQLTALFEGSKVGIAAEEGTFATSLTGVFACGSAIRSQKMAVRAVAQGKAAATSVDLYLKGKELQKPVKMFNSRFDKLTPAEYEEYLKESIPDNRVTPGKGMMEGFSAQEAMKEAARCLHCDCRKLDNCKLRTYADAYTIDRKKYVLGDRKVISKHFQHDTVVYEPEKCIKCGLCVDITLQNNELTGLSYVGRGFDVRIDVPFSQSLKEALINTAEKCVEACPTGALSSKK
jgi:NADPH-dependent glutamate synthase beta subunit-like oxidoreductase/ferredoxin